MGAGVTWRLVIASAPWAARAHHTTVIDAAGAIYVIGGIGVGGSTDYQDVWASTDGGSRPDSRGVIPGGYLVGTAGVLQANWRGTTGCMKDVEGY